ncbi:CDP-glycerol glycerophosphotransferase, TagB/SpsB family [Alkalibacterium putridalgicola]|uniref:Glycerophosphotransferase n=1 Tax=Alkalibacterium putridalgicola TaxID=426703 RepID=A0A1H7QP85_9LACT|nr:CDP-glycerol glycerophosphotransferase family protein [Alkalibacterium putridalgicola]GEK88388.1 glycerophosphotransferase [Alkalibacterium putridalgicola]SEL49786.1 CDP-glycerol glycerophosphotransferase, TagB/SpsB family [Alkalibacterium putridalgicola]
MHKIIMKICFIKYSIQYFLNLYLALLVFNIVYKGKTLKGSISMGSSSGKFCDENILELLKYLQNNNEYVNYIIDKDSPDYYKINKVTPPLKRFSFNANLKIFRSEIIIYDTSYIDLIRCNSKYIKHIKKINIFHGIHGLKKVSVQNANKRVKNDNYIIASSDYEAKIKESWGFSKDKIFVTGLPRFDNLERAKKNNKTENIIFFMPTWRPWFKRGFLNPSDKELNEFKNSNYYKNILKVASSKAINEYLKEHNFILEIYVHKLMNKYLNNVSGLNNMSNIHFLDDGTNIQNCIINSKILITDYSSIFFDFLYLEKPIILFQFDKNKYYRSIPGSYISDEEVSELTVFNADELFTKIKMHIKTQYDPFNIQSNRLSSRYIKFKDGNNCYRVYDMIKKIKD